MTAGSDPRSSPWSTNSDRPSDSLLTFEFDGPVDLIPDDIAEQVIAILREALANVGRHARASQVEITIDASDDLVMRITDNGVGLPSDAAAKGGNGLRNMAASQPRPTAARSKSGTATPRVAPRSSAGSQSASHRSHQSQISRVGAPPSSSRVANTAASCAVPCRASRAGSTRSS